MSVPPGYFGVACDACGRYAYGVTLTLAVDQACAMGWNRAGADWTCPCGHPGSEVTP